MVAITPPFTRSFPLFLSLLLSGNSRLHHARAIYPANPRTFRGRFAIPRKISSSEPRRVNLALIGRGGDLSLSPGRLKLPGISYLCTVLSTSWLPLFDSCQAIAQRWEYTWNWKGIQVRRQIAENTTQHPVSTRA